MRAASIVLALSVALAPFGCATAVDDPGFQGVDGGHGHADTATPLDDVGGPEDTGGGATDSGGARDSGGFDASVPHDTGSSDFDTGGSPVDSTIVGFDTGSVPDVVGPPPPTDASPPPPTDSTSGTCTTDADCTFPYNCCQILAGACGVYFGALCFPLP